MFNQVCTKISEKYEKKQLDILPLKSFDVADGEITNSLSIEFVIHYQIEKFYSRNKRKLIKNGEFIPIDNIIVDEFGYQKNVNMMKQKKFILAQYINILYKEVPINEQVFPLQFKSKKHKTPCGTTIEYFKSYLQYIKAMNNENIVKNVKIFWNNKQYVLNKYDHMNYKINKKIINLESIYNMYEIICKKFISYAKTSCNHLIIPFLYIKCPCSFIGFNRCNKFVNLFDFIIHLYIVKGSYNMTKFKEWIINDFIFPIILRLIQHNNNYIHVKNIYYKTKTMYKNNKYIKKIIQQDIHQEIRTTICEFCLKEKVTISYKYTKQFLKKKKYAYNLYCSCKQTICGKCGNGFQKHKGKKCPKPVVIEKPTEEELQSVQKALQDDNIQTAKCPKCHFLATKDENCDKVKCGAIDGGRQQGCGIQFCFRCGDDISELGANYLDHLIVTMKPDGSNTHWVCKKFAKTCPSCDIKQFWDGISDKIMCGQCKVEFEL